MYLVMRLYWLKTTPPSTLPAGNGTWRLRSDAGRVAHYCRISAFRHQPDMPTSPRHVRFTPNNGHWAPQARHLDLGYSLFNVLVGGP